MKPLNWFKDRVNKTIKRTRDGNVISYQHIKTELAAELAFMKQDENNRFEDNVPRKHRY